MPSSKCLRACFGIANSSALAVEPGGAWGAFCSDTQSHVSRLHCPHWEIDALPARRIARRPYLEVVVAAAKAAERDRACVVRERTMTVSAATESGEHDLRLAYRLFGCSIVHFHSERAGLRG